MESPICMSQVTIAAPMITVTELLFLEMIDICCEGSGDVVGVLTLLVGGVAQAFHDDRVVELRVQLGVEEVDGEGQEGRGAPMDMTVDDYEKTQDLSQ